MEQTDKWAKGKIAFITGATSGFGMALTRRIINGGGKVIATGRREERLDELVEEFGSAQLLTRQLDMCDTAAIAECVKNLPKDFKDIDILFNNAGLALGLGDAQNAKLSDWDTMIDTNVRGLVHLTRHVLDIMVKNDRGYIVNMSSVAGTYPYRGGNIYGGTKAFVRQFSLNLRSDLLGTKIRVTNVEPGMCETEFSVVRFNGDHDAADNVYKGMKPLSADDVALTVENVLRLPEHININRFEVMPVQQAFAGFSVDRK